MTIETAIEKAIEGGWIYRQGMSFREWHYYDKGRPFVRAYFDTSSNSHDIQWEEIMLDPIFWQSLGKAMGWQECYYQYHYKFNEPYPFNVKSKSMSHQPHYLLWQYYWHSLIDHLADGGTIEEYFKKLWEQRPVGTILAILRVTSALSVACQYLMQKKSRSEYMPI